MTDRFDGFDVIIVGGGHAGAQTAISLRQLGHEGSIAIISEELEPPYERPPLSKDYLLGAKTFERILIRPANFWAERRVELLTGQKVVAVDTETRRVTLAGGGTRKYGTLVWAAGGTPRRLTCAGSDATGIHSVRNRADVDRMLIELPDVTRIVVIGGGYIGLEAAAVLAKLGKSVTVVEAQDRVLARVGAAPLSRFLEAAHRDHGVEIRLSTTVACIEVRDGRAVGVRLGNDEVLACEMVIVGIGIEPAVAPLLAAGAEGGNGVTVDAQCRASLPGVFAVGDCAAHPNVHADGLLIRLESVQNANDQALVAARTILGLPASYDALPWFWSNQYDLKLQTIGLSAGHDETIVRGDPASGAFSLVYLRTGQVLAIDSVNVVRDYVQGRTLIGREIADRVALADPLVPLKTL